MTLSNQAYEIIKRQIVTLQLAPGSIVDESALGEALGFGRTPIREALQQLKRDKLVTIVPRRGIFVTDVSMADLSLLYESRKVLEAYIARVAAQRGSAADWQRMQDVLDGVNSDGQIVSDQQLIEADRLCHEIMFDAARHPYLQETMIMLYAQSQRLWHKYLREVDMRTAIHEHAEILAALRTGDGDQAAKLIDAHITVFQEMIRDVMVQELMR